MMSNKNTMDREYIISLAREAGFDEYGSSDLILERFAALVIAAEREACAKVCEETTAAWNERAYKWACET
jgi:hypothetical protein